MRLQSAIFTLGDTLFTPDGAAREGLDKALSLSVSYTHLTLPTTERV